MKVERINEYIALHRETPITELRDISPAIWDHTVDTGERVLTPARQAGTQFTYPGRMEG